MPPLHNPRCTLLTQQLKCTPPPPYWCDFQARRGVGCHELENEIQYIDCNDGNGRWRPLRCRSLPWEFVLCPQVKLVVYKYWFEYLHRISANVMLDRFSRGGQSTTPVDSVWHVIKDTNLFVSETYTYLLLGPGIRGVGCESGAELSKWCVCTLPRFSFRIIFSSGLTGQGIRV
jgi:hypothetical protein